MVYGYIRVSTDRQTVENQRFGIKGFCKKNNMQIDKWIEESVSGTKDVDKRKLGALLNDLQKGDLLICTELSRLGRSFFMVMAILNECMKKEIQIWTIKDNYRLGNDISSAVIAFAFALSAQIERDLISQRSKESLARAKAEGIHCGRPKGSKNKLPTILRGKEKVVLQLLAKGLSKVQVCDQLGIGRSSLYTFVKGKKIFKKYKGKRKTVKIL